MDSVRAYVCMCVRVTIYARYKRVCVCAITYVRGGAHGHTRETHVRATAGLHVREVTHVGEYLRYLWAIFPIQLLLSKPLPVQHVRNKKLDKIISTSRHGFDSLKLVKSYGAGIRGILFYFLSLRALSLSLYLPLPFCLSLFWHRFFVSSLFFADALFFVIPLSKHPMADRESIHLERIKAQFLCTSKT